MEDTELLVGSRVQVTGYGPFRRLSGTILMVDTIPTDLEEPFCFYLIALEEANINEPVWFTDDEVELVSELPPSPHSTGNVNNSWAEYKT